jgi:hypothetical protein
MNKPEDLILSNGGSYFREGCIGALAGIGVMVFVGAIALTQTDATLADLVLPMAALSVFWLSWVAINIFVGWVHYLGTKRDVNRLFEKEIWQQWQFRSDEWQRIVEAEYQTMRPESGIGAYSGALYSTIAGLVFGIFLVGIGKFAIKDEQVMPIIFICAGAVVVLFAGAGLVQPLLTRRNAQRYRQKALRVREPRVWFGAEGIYHEALGYTSLKELKNVSDHIQARRTITFTTEVTVGGGDEPMTTFDQPTAFSVPSGCEQQAAQLVRRYRQERMRG